MTKKRHRKFWEIDVGIFWKMQKFFRKMSKKRSLKNFVKTLAPVSEGLDPLLVIAVKMGFHLMVFRNAFQCHSVEPIRQHAVHMLLILSSLHRGSRGFRGSRPYDRTIDGAQKLCV